MPDDEIQKWIRLTINSGREQEAVERLAEIGEPAVEPLIHWFYICPQPPENIQWENIPWIDLSEAALKRIGKPALPHLIAWYKRDKSWRHVIVSYMKAIGPTQEILDFLYDEWTKFSCFPPKIQGFVRKTSMDLYTRMYIAEIFAEQKERRYQLVLQEMLNDGSAFVISPALLGLAKHGDRTALSSIQRVIDKYHAMPPPPFVRLAEEARRAITEILKRYPT